MLDKVIDKAGGVLTEAYGDVVKPVLKPNYQIGRASCRERV